MIKLLNVSSDANTESLPINCVVTCPNAGLDATNWFRKLSSSTFCSNPSNTVAPVSFVNVDQKYFNLESPYT